MSRSDQLRQARNHLAEAETRRDNLKRDIKVWRQRIAELEAKPTLTSPPYEATFIKFDKKFETYGKVYEYGAMKVGALWYVTGKTGPNGVTWDDLVDFIAEDNRLIPGYRYFVGHNITVTSR